MDDKIVALKLRDNLELRFPAYPAPCEFVQVVHQGKEVAYWQDTEFAEDPADVLGALLGCLSSYCPVESSEVAER